MKVRMKTNYGDILLALDPGKAPKTVKNFVGYVNDGYYDGTIFHRVIDGFMIQGGGFEPGMRQKDSGAPIDNEADNGLTNDQYTVAMARTPDPHSASSQFFINANDNDFLNFRSRTADGWGYCVFGKVIEGKNVVYKINEVPTTSRGGHQDVPQDDVVLEKAELLED